MHINFQDNIYVYSIGYDSFLGIVIAENAEQATKIVESKYPEYNVLVTENDLIDWNNEKIYEILSL